MEKYIMFMGQKNQYSENEYTTKTIYRFHAHPIKLPVVFFRELEQIIFIICMEIQKTLNSQRDLEKEWNGRNQPA